MVPLADDFFRLTHYDVTGRLRLHTRAAGLGLAAALLAELTFDRKLVTRDGQLTVFDHSPPADALAHRVLDQLAAQPGHTSVRTWLDFLSRDAVEQVAERLWHAGHLRPEHTRRLLTRHTVWVPTDMNTAAWPWARLGVRLRHREPLDPSDAFLAGLVAVTGLSHHLLPDAPHATANYLRHVVASAHPYLRDLLLHTEAAVGDAVLSYRS